MDGSNTRSKDLGEVMKVATMLKTHNRHEDKHNGGSIPARVLPLILTIATLAALLW